MSIETQLFHCQNYCEENKLKISYFESEVCRAVSISNQRKLLKIINTNRNINIIIYDASRFSRSVYDGINLLRKCKNKNIIIHLVKDLVTSNNRFGYLKIVDGIKNAEIESATASERVRNAIKFRRSLGHKIGRCPFGYKVVKTNNIRKFVIDETGQNIISLMKTLYFGGSIAIINSLMDKIVGYEIDQLFSDDTNIIKYGNITSLLFTLCI
jgi:DNA invertase Pin-like site-specific DNA recombinase